MSAERADLERLMSEPLPHAKQRQSETFDRVSQGRGIVLMGAGRLGRRTLAGLRSVGVEPLAFSDNFEGAHGSSIEGVAVLPPAEAAREFGDRAAFVVTIWGANSSHRFAHTREQLRSLGCDVVSSFPPLFWKYSDALLPFYLQDLPSRVLEQQSAVLKAYDLWEDVTSRREYVAQVRFRLTADFDSLAHPVEHPQYFPHDLLAWRDDEWFVDGGAYNGDTIRALSEIHGDRFGHVLALEPDPANFGKLTSTVDALSEPARSRIECRQIALAAQRRQLYLDATGTASSATTLIASTDATRVAGESLDSLVEHVEPTFVKLDIEGFEVDALMGARNTIQRHAPVVAVCVYHRQDHLWKIPLMLRSWSSDYAFFLRPHNEEGWDLVCYAIPRSRLRGAPA